MATRFPVHNKEGKSYIGTIKKKKKKKCIPIDGLVKSSHTFSEWISCKICYTLSTLCTLRHYG